MQKILEVNIHKNYFGSYSTKNKCKTAVINSQYSSFVERAYSNSIEREGKTALQHIQQKYTT
jgi:hypothetical protein